MRLQPNEKWIGYALVEAHSLNINPIYLADNRGEVERLADAYAEQHGYRPPIARVLLTAEILEVLG